MRLVALPLLLLAASAYASSSDITGRYVCGDGAQFYATSSADMDTVTFRIDGRIYPLTSAVTASGAAWSDGDWKWWTKGTDTNFVMRGETIVHDNCRKQRPY
ncbi:MliC family protein [Andreprevotia chitinilytica]|uniref:MliC family protein n=1 Tax=Andreprevotia chitinilytica TaxID=396808 RepID=UPI00069031C9|nr:MliC family protein [Andreprevotia chitinilytica]